jgi:hypothetical protein
LLWQRLKEWILLLFFALNERFRRSRFLNADNLEFSLQRLDEVSVLFVRRRKPRNLGLKAVFFFSKIIQRLAVFREDGSPSLLASRTRLDIVSALSAHPAALLTRHHALPIIDSIFNSPAVIGHCLALPARRQVESYKRGERTVSRIERKMRHGICPFTKKVALVQSVLTSSVIIGINRPSAIRSSYMPNSGGIAVPAGTSKKPGMSTTAGCAMTGI